MSYFLPCGTQEELWLPFPSYTLESVFQPLQRTIAAGQLKMPSSILSMEASGKSRG